MRKKPKPAIQPTSSKGGLETDLRPGQISAPRQQFLAAAITMSWQLAIVVLVPIIGGVELDKALKTSSAYLYVGLVIALVGSAAVMRRAMQAANQLPVPKLSAAQKQAIKKSYEAEDDD